MKKIISMLLILFIIMIGGCVNAVEENEYFTINDKLVVGKKLDTNTYEPSELTEKDYQKAFDKASNIVSTITMVGIVISITMVSVLGIKYMIGSVEEKAEYKKTMIPMIIGAILLFTTSTIVSIIYQLTSQL